MYVQCNPHADFYKLMIDSNKTQMPGTIASLDLPDSQQAAVSLRGTHGHTAKRDTNGKLVYIYNVQVLTQQNVNFRLYEGTEICKFWISGLA